MMLAILSNEIVQAVVASMMIAQLIKLVTDDRPFNPGTLFRGAGMPSSHTSTVVALTTAVYITEGLSSLFLVTLFLSGIVLRDVLGDKMFAKHQEDKINNFLKEVVDNKEIHWKHLIGHTISEVGAGIVLGITVTLLIFFFNVDYTSIAVYEYLNGLLR